MWSAIVCLTLIGSDPQSEAALRVRQAALARIPLAQKVAKDPELLAALEAKNASSETAEDIRRKDESWARSPRDPLRRELVSNACAARLRSLVAADPVVVEAFLMDGRGSLVCTTVETSDYWQGDEAKWQLTYEGGEPVLVEEPKFDESVQTFAVQLSVLVTNRGHKAGALTLTLKVPRALAIGN